MKDTETQFCVSEFKKTLCVSLLNMSDSVKIVDGVHLDTVSCFLVMVILGFSLERLIFGNVPKILPKYLPNLPKQVSV